MKTAFNSLQMPTSIPTKSVHGLWTIKKEGCSANPASITVINNEVITEPEIEPFSVLISCQTDGFDDIFANLTNQLIPGETGTWTGPPGVTFSPNSESPTVSGLLPGENELTWTISRGNCPVKVTSVTLVNDMVMTDAQLQAHRKFVMKIILR